MELDVTGRTAKAVTGKARGQITAANNPENLLQYTAAGILPADCHNGLSHSAHGRKHIPSSARPVDHATGKRHIEVQHEVPSDMAKRMAGKFGLKKIKWTHEDSNPDRRTVRRRNGGDGGGDPTAHHASPAAAVKTSDRNESCETRAKRVVAEIASTKPQYEHEIKKAIEVGGSALLECEAKLRRAVQAEERLAHAVPVRSKVKPETLGDPSTFAPPAPFAMVSTPQPIFHPAKKHITEPRPADNIPRSKRMVPGASHFNQEHDGVPFDNALSNQSYPEPPSFGVIHSPAGGKRHVDPFVSINKEDIDSRSNRVAAAKAARRDPSQPVMPDFVFGNPPPLQAGARSPQRPRTSNMTLLDHQSAGPLPPRPASRFSHITHKPTALW